MAKPNYTFEKRQKELAKKKKKEEKRLKKADTITGEYQTDQSPLDNDKNAPIIDDGI